MRQERGQGPQVHFTFCYSLGGNLPLEKGIWGASSCEMSLSQHFDAFFMGPKRFASVSADAVSLIEAANSERSKLTDGFSEKSSQSLNPSY